MCLFNLDLTPRTNEIASMRLLFPAPFGPTRMIGNEKGRAARLTDRFTSLVDKNYEKKICKI